MPPAKRRKLAEAATTTSCLPPRQTDIQAFGRVSKGHNASAVGAKKAIVSETITTSLSSSNASSITSPSKKRKIEPEVGTSRARARSSVSLDARRLKSATQLSHRHEESATVFHTPTKGAGSRLETFDFNSSSPNSPTRFLSPSLKGGETPPTSPCSSTTPETDAGFKFDRLPSELDDYIALYSAFLTALSLHFAHHGSSTPADLKLLIGSTERIWGKRKVVVDDIRKLLALMGESEDGSNVSCCKLELKNIGFGRIVLENSIVTEARGSISKPFDEGALRIGFENTLGRLWSARNNDELGGSEFLKSLPLASISTIPSVVSSSVKVQRRLEDLKAGAIKIQEKKAASNSGARKDAAAVNSREQSLMGRIKAKELQEAKLPPPPSKETLLRRSALQRIEDIAGVLSMLKTETSAKSSSESSSSEMQLHEKSSFSFSTLVQKVKDSARTPISCKEVEICLHLFADELAVDWVKSVSIGKLKCMVLYHQKQPGVEVLKKRVLEALQETR